MRLVDLLFPWIPDLKADCLVQGLENDSRRIKPGDLFFAYPGFHVDGRQFIEQACASGASAIVYEVGDAVPKVSCPLVPMQQVARYLGLIAARFYDFPSQQLGVIGVTGTNGKTTIAHQLAEAYQLLGEKSAYVGTLGQGSIGHITPLSNTTPDGIMLQKLFHTFVQAGVGRLCMEVSSHALVEQRVEGTFFKQAIFTNLSREHLDFHGTMEAYRDAKAKLFAWEGLTYGIVNGDDEASPYMIAAMAHSQAKVLQYGFAKHLDIRAIGYEVERGQTHLKLETPWGKGEVTIRALGLFNVYNTLAVLTSLLLEDYPFDEVLTVLSKLQSVPGRMETVATEPLVIVDYAHTPDALENVLKTLKTLVKGKGRLWVVFGCGGNRDTGKRPEMGRIACQYGDRVVVTSDNPREEDPEKIIQEIMTGILPQADVKTIVDRKEAIKTVLSEAAPSDLVLVAGKGHETYQQVGQKKHPFSDKLIIQQALTEVK